MDKIIITGANGFIGSHLIDLCISNGYEVYGLERPDQIYKNLSHYTFDKEMFSKEEKQEYLGELISIPTNNKRLVILECDVKNALLLEKIIRKIEPKFIFHFAAQPYILQSWEDPVETIEVNVIGTINVFQPLIKYKLETRVILACTSTEYDTKNRTGAPLKETDPLLALHPYGISKIAAELLARQYFSNFNVEIINLRFFNQTGIRRINDAPSDFIRKLIKIELGLDGNKLQVGNLNPYRDFTDIKDSVLVILLAATNGKPGETYNVCSGKKVQIREILNIVLSFSNEKIEVVENDPQKLRKVDEDIIIGDNSKIKIELGWEPTLSIEETLKEMYFYWLNYYKRQKL